MARQFLVLCVFVLFAAVVLVESADDALPLTKKVAKVFETMAARYTQECAKEAAKHCGIKYDGPKSILSIPYCAVQYFFENKSTCRKH